MPGGGGKSGGGGSSSTTTVQQLSPEQQKLFGLTFPVFDQYFDTQGGTNAKPYEGQTLAATNPLQTLGQSMALGNALGPVSGAVDATLKGTNFLTSGDVLNPASNPGLQGTLDAATRQITDNFSRNILPGIRDQSVISGGYGGNRQGIAEGIAASDATKQVGDTSATILNQAYQSGLDAMTKGLGFAPSNIQSAFAPAQAVSGIGDIQQSRSQSELNDIISNYYTKEFFPLQLAEEVAQIALGMPGGSASKANFSDTGGGSTFNNILSGLSGGAGIVGALLPFLL